MRLVLRDRVIDCTSHTAVMGILNVSHDSPIGQSIVPPARALERALELRAAGAEIIDVGAHSTRTGARAVSPQEEVERVCPAIEALTREGLAVSVDTWSPLVARAAAEAGAHLLNDVTGLVDDDMLAVAREYQLPAVVMHMRGAPTRHREADQRYDDVATEVRSFLLERARALEEGGGPQAWLDPGFGFGKAAADNVRLLHALPELVATGRPVVVSASRKGFLAELLGYGDRQDAPGLLEATVAFNVLAASYGAHVVRVHDVAEVAHALRIVDAGRRQASARPRSTDG